MVYLPSPLHTAGITQSSKLQAKLVKACDQRESQYARVEICLASVGVSILSQQQTGVT